MTYTTDKEVALKAPTSKAAKIKVRVVFPLATGEPYKSTEDPETTVGEVRHAAMRHFGVDEDPGSRYYLGEGRHGDEIGDEVTLASVDEEEPGKLHAKFTLIKELIQG